MTLVDSNVLIDIFEHDANWWPRSIAALARREAMGPIAINDVIYAELAAGFSSRAALDREVDAIGLSIERLSHEALYRAGQTFRAYRAKGGTRTNVLADFFIGAQAEVEGWPILTRDVARYRTYFTDVTVVGVEG